MSTIKQCWIFLCYNNVIRRKEVFHMSKPIKNHFELKDVCRKATSYFVGSFMLGFIVQRKLWETPETKTKFIEDFHKEYCCWDDHATIERTRNRVNCMIRIIESNLVTDALQYVLDADDSKLDCPQAKENARDTLRLIEAGRLNIQTGELKYWEDKI